jgi:hypothetical protein
MNKYICLPDRQTDRPTQYQTTAMRSYVEKLDKLSKNDWQLRSQLQNSLLVKRSTKINYGLRLRGYITADKIQDIWTYHRNYRNRISYEVADVNETSGWTRIKTGPLSTNVTAKTKTKTEPKWHYGWHQWHRNNLIYRTQVLAHRIYPLALGSKFCNHWEKAKKICIGNVQHTGTEAHNFWCKNTKQVKVQIQTLKLHALFQHVTRAKAQIVGSHYALQKLYLPILRYRSRMQIH